MPDKDIWCYSGFTFEEITGNSRANCEFTKEFLSYLDVLVDGRFVAVSYTHLAVHFGTVSKAGYRLEALAEA